MNGMITNRLFAAGFSLLIMFILTLPAGAQIALSPRGSVSQTLDGTTISVEYSRPTLKGRTGLFGGQIFWGHIWTPGADAATTIEINNDITLSGTDVPAGKYSLWMVVADGDWEVILKPDWDLFHWPEPARTDDEITFWVTPNTEGEELETLTFDFPTLTAFTTILRLRWEGHTVELPIEVESRLQLTVTEEEVAPYTGTYTTDVFQNEMVSNAFSYDMEFRFEDEKLVTKMKFRSGGNGSEWDLLPRVPQIFHPAFFEDGEIVSSLAWFFEFELDEYGRAKSFELRDDDDELMMRGARSVSSPSLMPEE